MRGEGDVRGRHRHYPGVRFPLELLMISSTILTEETGSSSQKFHCHLRNISRSAKKKLRSRVCFAEAGIYQMKMNRTTKFVTIAK
jgi:hypothetical protein